MLGLGLSLTIGGLIASATGKIVSAFVARVIADGGTVESPACLKAAINAIGNADTPISLFEAYDVRVVAAGGTTEARDCTIAKLGQTL